MCHSASRKNALENVSLTTQVFLQGTEEILQWLRVTLSEFQPQIEFMGLWSQHSRQDLNTCVTCGKALLTSVCLCFPIFTMALVVGTPFSHHSEE